MVSDFPIDRLEQEGEEMISGVVKKRSKGVEKKIGSEGSQDLRLRDFLSRLWWRP
jgi:hypothetical protein